MEMHASLLIIVKFLNSQCVISALWMQCWNAEHKHFPLFISIHCVCSYNKNSLGVVITEVQKKMNVKHGREMFLYLDILSILPCPVVFIKMSLRTQQRIMCLTEMRPRWHLRKTFHFQFSHPCTNCLRIDVISRGILWVETQMWYVNQCPTKSLQRLTHSCACFKLKLSSIK